MASGRGVVVRRQKAKPTCEREKSSLLTKDSAHESCLPITKPCASPAAYRQGHGTEGEQKLLSWGALCPPDTRLSDSSRNCSAVSSLHRRMLVTPGSGLRWSAQPWPRHGKRSQPSNPHPPCTALLPAVASFPPGSPGSWARTLCLLEVACWVSEGAE